MAAATELWSGARTFRWQELRDGVWADLHDGAYERDGMQLCTLSACTARAIQIHCDLPDASIWQFSIRMRCIINDCLEVPYYFSLGFCDAEFNCEGVLDLADYLDFAAAFAADDAAADFNRDGTLDLFDMLDYVAAYAEGCS